MKRDINAEIENALKDKFVNEISEFTKTIRSNQDTNLEEGDILHFVPGYRILQQTFEGSNNLAEFIVVECVNKTTNQESNKRIYTSTITNTLFEADVENRTFKGRRKTEGTAVNLVNSFVDPADAFNAIIANGGYVLVHGGKDVQCGTYKDGSTSYEPEDIVTRKLWQFDLCDKNGNMLKPEQIVSGTAKANDPDDNEPVAPARKSKGNK